RLVIDPGGEAGRGRQPIRAVVVGERHEAGRTGELRDEGPPGLQSVNRIGSRVRSPASGNDTSLQLAFAGVIESSKVTRSVSSPAMYSTLPLFQLTPRLGSPASWPSEDGAWKRS